MKTQKSKPSKESKLKILAAGDIHGDFDIAKLLAAKAKSNKVDLVVLAGDLHGMIEGTSDMIIEPFKKNHQKVVFVPGNWDSSLEVDMLKEMHKIKNIDGYYVTYNGVDIVGIGNPDFKMSFNQKEARKKLSENFDRIRAKGGKKILVSHLHASGTNAEFSGFKGEKVLRDAIEYFQPDVFISAHIHEAEGIEEKIGKTRVINVGRRGKIIEV